MRLIYFLLMSSLIIVPNTIFANINRVLQDALEWVSGEEQSKQGKELDIVELELVSMRANGYYFKNKRWMIEILLSENEYRQVLESCVRNLGTSMTQLGGASIWTFKDETFYLGPTDAQLEGSPHTLMAGWIYDRKMDKPYTLRIIVRGVDRMFLSSNPEMFSKVQPREIVKNNPRIPSDNKDVPLEVGMRTGTGFIVSPDGFIVTNAHVVVDCDTLKVRLVDGRLFDAELVRQDPKEDLAVLKITTGGKLPNLRIVDDKGVSLGTNVYTVGFPNVTIQGVSPKLTSGSIDSMAGLKDNPKHYQISVPIQPGNSGGPLLNERNQIVGVIQARLSDTAAMKTTGALPQSVNYAIKSSVLLKFLADIIEGAPIDSEVKTKEGVPSSVVLILAKRNAMSEKPNTAPDALKTSAPSQIRVNVKKR